jgi:hypothetical protein
MTLLTIDRSIRPERAQLVEESARCFILGWGAVLWSASGPSGVAFGKARLVADPVFEICLGRFGIERQSISGNAVTLPLAMLAEAAEGTLLHGSVGLESWDSVEDGSALREWDFAVAGRG